VFDIDTLFIISSARGAYALNDLISAIQWSCGGGSRYIVAVDETSQLDQLQVEGHYQVLHSELPEGTPAGFHRAAGLKWAIDKGIAYKQVVMMDDSCLIMGQGMDDFLIEQTTKDNIGVIGVRDSVTYTEPTFKQATALLYEWGLPHEAIEHAPPVVQDAFLVLSAKLAGVLYQRGLLVPKGVERWQSAAYSTFLSWACQMLNFYLVSWGSAEKVLPPFYITRAHGPYMPSPTILAQRFYVFSSVRDVLGYSESDLRELFKQARGEPHREIKPFGPQLSGTVSQ